VVVVLTACLAGLAAPAEAARRLGDRPLASGSRGTDVRTLQRGLTALRFPARPTDGVYGRRTRAAVRRWERARRMRIDGRISRPQGRRVRRELLAKRKRDAARGPVPGAGPGSNAAVGPGASAAAIAQAQRALAALRFDPGSQDGVYGEGTAAAIRGYQGAFFASQSGVLSAAEATLLDQRVASVPAAAHSFPVAGSWRFGGASGRFGDDRGSHRHGGQDMAAAAGTPLVAVTAGLVSVRAYQASGAGNYVVLQGDDGVDYVYMHMQSPASVAPNTRVAAGQQLGAVGTTGRSTGPHLHFEMWTRHWYDGGAAFDPLPALLAWR